MSATPPPGADQAVRNLWDLLTVVGDPETHKQRLSDYAEAKAAAEAALAEAHEKIKEASAAVAEAVKVKAEAEALLESARARDAESRAEAERVSALGGTLQQAKADHEETVKGHAAEVAQKLEELVDREGKVGAREAAVAEAEKAAEEVRATYEAALAKLRQAVG